MISKINSSWMMVDLYFGPTKIYLNDFLLNMYEQTMYYVWRVEKFDYAISCDPVVITTTITA